MIITSRVDLYTMYENIHHKVYRIYGHVTLKEQVFYKITEVK